MPPYFWTGASLALDGLALAALDAYILAGGLMVMTSSGPQPADTGTTVAFATFGVAGALAALVGGLGLQRHEQARASARLLNNTFESDQRIR